MGIVIEPITEPSHPTPPSVDHGASPPDWLPIDAIASRRPKRARLPSASWLVAAAAVAIAAATVVAAPVNGSAGSDDRRTVPTAPADQSEWQPANGIPDIVNPILAPACNYLFDVAATALELDRDSYARAALTISATQGRTLNDVAHRDLAAARDAVTRSSMPPDRRATELEALDIALSGADGAPCSPVQLSPREPRSSPITGHP